MNLFEKMIRELKVSNHPTIMYGSGALSVMVDSYLKQNGIIADGFAVDREYYREPTHNGKPVYILSDYVANNLCNIILAFSYLTSEWENKLRSIADSRPDTKIYLLDFPAYLSLYGDHSQYGSFYKENKPALDKLRAELCDESSKTALDDFIDQKLTGVYRKPFSDKPAFFDGDVLEFSDREVYVDCGAYNGDTVIGFIENLERGGYFFTEKFMLLKQTRKMLLPWIRTWRDMIISVSLPRVFMTIPGFCGSLPRGALVPIFPMMV